MLHSTQLHPHGGLFKGGNLFIKNGFEGQDLFEVRRGEGVIGRKRLNQTFTVPLLGPTALKHLNESK